MCCRLMIGDRTWWPVTVVIKDVPSCFPLYLLYLIRTDIEPTIYLSQGDHEKKRKNIIREFCSQIKSTTNVRLKLHNGQDIHPLSLYMKFQLNH
jgi:hypothetical protein